MSTANNFRQELVIAFFPIASEGKPVMDLLKSFNMDQLPEQQTRFTHLMDEHPDFDLSLGFDACCTCGKQLGPSSPAVPCRNCRRVNYCSDICRQQDANVALPDEGAEGETDLGLGHSAVVCAVLRLCQDDEAVDDMDISSLDPSRIKAARDRLLSEKESYPATLANVIAEGPCYVEALRKCSASRKLVCHVIGASVEGELWDTTENDTSFVNAYAEALSDVAAAHNLDTIDLIFVGPECPEQDLELTSPMQSLQRDHRIGDLLARTIRGQYSKDLLSQRDAPKADIVVLFNPGFTVPEYDWSETLRSIEKGTPFLSTTNTELEGIADCQYLLDQDKIQSIPPGLAEIFGLYRTDDSGRGHEAAFFSENPFCGSRVRQNGTMANDLFVKNHWILGGILDSFDPAKAQKVAPAKRLKLTGDSLNSKAGNPALI